MNAEQKQAHAKSLWASPLTHEILDRIERSATSAAINAKPDDINATRQHLSDARAVRSFRSKLKSLANEADAEREGGEE